MEPAELSEAITHAIRKTLNSRQARMERMIAGMMANHSAEMGGEAYLVTKAGKILDAIDNADEDEGNG